MSDIYPLELAFLDALPPLIFGVGLGYLIRAVQRLGDGAAVRLTTWGGALVFMGGFLKACWKLLMALQVANVQVLSDQQFVLLAPGFLLLWWGTLRMLRVSPRGAVVTAIAPWKIPLLALMTLGSLGVHVTLAVLSFRRGLRLAGSLFIVAVVCMFAMSGMARGEQRIALQWIEQGVNILGQSTFALGCWQVQRSTRMV